MKTLGYLSLLISLIVLGVFFYLFALDANPPIEILSAPYISPSEANPGNNVTMTVSYCKYTDTDSSFSAFWRRENDGLVWELTQRTINVSVADCGTLILPLVIPEDIPPGRWQRVNIATYRVNPIASRTVEWRSDYITVLEK